MEGMSSPKPGPISAPSTSTAHGMASGRLGDDMAHELHVIAGNPDKSMLGGDNRTDLGLHAIAGNPAPQAVTAGDPGWTGCLPLRCIEGNPDASELKGWMRGGSDALTMDGRTGGH